MRDYRVMKKLVLIAAFSSLLTSSLSADVLDDLIIKKKPRVNAIIIVLLKAGLTNDHVEPELAQYICKAGGGSGCGWVNSVGEAICIAGGGSGCGWVNSVGEGICKAGGGSGCGWVNSVGEGIKKIPYKDRTYWWDRFKDQYGNYQWRCRGGQTKQFAENSNCSGVNKDDDRWPG